MNSTLKPKQADDPHDFVVVPPSDVRVVPGDDELSDLLHQAARYRSDSRTNAASDGPPVPPVDTAFRAAAVNDVLLRGHRRPIGERALRGIVASLLAACIGVAAIAWQASGDVAKQMIAKWAPQLVLASLLSPEKAGLSAQPAPPVVPAEAANAGPPPSAAPAQAASQAVADTAADPAAESAMLSSTARDLATVTQEIEQLKTDIEQLKASQQQMSRDFARASLQNDASSHGRVSEQNLRPAISASPPRPAAARARKPPPQIAAAPGLPRAAPYYPPRPPEPQPQVTAQPQADPELSSVPRPPMPVRQ